MLPLPFMTELKKRSRWSAGNRRKSKVFAPGLTRRVPWQREQLIAYVCSPRLIRCGENSSSADAAKGGALITSNARARKRRIHIAERQRRGSRPGANLVYCRANVQSAPPFGMLARRGSPE